MTKSNFSDKSNDAKDHQRVFFDQIEYMAFLVQLRTLLFMRINHHFEEEQYLGLRKAVCSFWIYKFGSLYEVGYAFFWRKSVLHFQDLIPPTLPGPARVLNQILDFQWKGVFLQALHYFAICIPIIDNFKAPPNETCKRGNKKCVNSQPNSPNWPKRANI